MSQRSRLPKKVTLNAQGNVKKESHVDVPTVKKEVPIRKNHKPVDVTSVVSRLYEPTISTIGKCGASKSDIAKEVEKRKRHDSGSSDNLTPTAMKPATKRSLSNLTQTKCKTQFSSQPNTVFNTKPPVSGERIRRFSASKQSNTKSQSYNELKKKTSDLEDELNNLKNLHVDKVKHLEQSLEQATKEAEMIKQENEEVTSKLQQKEKYYKETMVESKKDQDTLKSKVEDCEKKLLQCKIDPVTLKSMENDSDEEAQIEKRRQEAKAKAIAFKEKLDKFNLKSQLHLDSLKETLGKCISTTWIAMKTQY
ncbi:unnamed protein product [Owenia fusiformis]|uniref:Uncharacterized protein n=1 Tax=Owenia fusiformis TaxID=6347 RepID=A0A8J1XXG4_OWEFU|nr:unnamed protein product [Owenia fusiformis]